MQADTRRVCDRDLITEEIVKQATRLIERLVGADAALGWVDPPDEAYVGELLRTMAERAARGDAALRLAVAEHEVVAFGYWLRYERPTHRPHADLERVAVALDHQRMGIGGALTRALIADARASGVEQLTLDLRDDNLAAQHLYLGLGFREYGRLPDFVAVGQRRLGKVLMVRDRRDEEAC